MSLRSGVLALLVAGLSLVAVAEAQVMADVRVGSGPVAGRVIVGDRYVAMNRPIVVHRPVTYLIPVERVGYRDARWLHRRGWRPMTVWFDGRQFIHPSSTWRRHYQEVVVFERGGRFLLGDLGRGRGYDRNWHGGGGRYDPYDDRRWED
mgnify:CR=1 FL=1